MLYIFYGTDSVKSTNKARTLVNSLRQKKPEATYLEISRDNFIPSLIDENIGGQGLFSQKYIIFLNEVSVDEESKNKVVETLSLMKDSANIFIISEGKVNAEMKKAFDKYGDKVVVSDLVQNKEGKREFNVFLLSDAIGARDSFKAWYLYREAIDRGLEAESILGTIFWQFKSMISASSAKSASESGLNPFVYSKAKKSSANYGAEELKAFLDRSLSVYHDAHRGLIDMELGIERMLLEI